MTDIHATTVDNARDGETKTEKSWRNILVVTNEFHIHRTKAIFHWIFGAPSLLPNTLDTRCTICHVTMLALTIKPLPLERHTRHKGRRMFD